MSNNFILFYLYLLMILLFLSILSYLISIELFYLFYIIFFTKINYNLSQVDKETFIHFVNLYTKRKEWLLFISMLEFYLNKKRFDPVTIYNNLGYCYSSLYYFQIAEYYYCNALLIDKNSMLTLQNLSQLYKKFSNDNKLNQINNMIALIKN
uniref:Ycf37 n=1 Tax=Dasya naccarioides TaxID=2007180 RepID=A0A1Z1MH57_9FLOR|nr:hypothetical protein [Dasya naccarioides]ARW65084.1 hypothetical protein [Dasya naccarioides]